MPHTAEVCADATHDHFGQKDNWENGNDTPWTGSDELLCNDCSRPMYYDRTDEQYHHLDEPERGCFLIPAEHRPAPSIEAVGGHKAEPFDPRAEEPTKCRFCGDDIRRIPGNRERWMHSDGYVVSFK